MERIQAEVDQRCDGHQYYAGICDCNKEKEAGDNEADENHEYDVVDEDEDLKPDDKVEVNDTGSNTQRAVDSNEEDLERKKSKVCTML